MWCSTSSLCSCPCLYTAADRLWEKSRASAGRIKVMVLMKLRWRRSRHRSGDGKQVWDESDPLLPAGNEQLLWTSLCHPFIYFQENALISLCIVATSIKYCSHLTSLESVMSHTLIRCHLITWSNYIPPEFLGELAKYNGSRSKLGSGLCHSREVFCFQFSPGQELSPSV